MTKDELKRILSKTTLKFSSLCSNILEYKTTLPILYKEDYRCFIVKFSYTKGDFLDYENINDLTFGLFSIQLVRFDDENDNTLLYLKPKGSNVDFTKN